MVRLYAEEVGRNQRSLKGTECVVRGLGFILWAM